MAFLYILNPGDGHDAQTFDVLPNASQHAGELYRSHGKQIWHFDRVAGNWYEYDSMAQASAVPIKVLRAAGTLP